MTDYKNNARNVYYQISICSSNDVFNYRVFISFAVLRKYSVPKVPQVVKIKSLLG